MGGSRGARSGGGSRGGARTEVHRPSSQHQGGELFDRIAECGGLPEDEARRYFVHIVSALHHCHQNQVYHRDLKPENILLDGQVRLHVLGGAGPPRPSVGEGRRRAPPPPPRVQDNAKVADFGLAAVYRHMNDDARYLRHTKVGSVMYAAPEVLTSTAQAGYDAAAADMWSLGIILFSMLSGTLPFQCAAASRCKRYAAVLQQGIQVMCPDTLSPDVTALLARMIHPDPKQRYTPEEALQCAWLGQKSQGAGEEARGVCGRGASDTAVDAQPRGAPPDAQPRSWTILLQLPEQRAPELGPPPSALHPDAGAQKRKRDEGDASSAPQPPGPGDFAVPLPPITAALLNRTEPDTQPRLESRDEGDGADGEASSATGAREATPSSSSNPLAALPLTGCLTEFAAAFRNAEFHRPPSTSSAPPPPPPPPPPRLSQVRAALGLGAVAARDRAAATRHFADIVIGLASNYPMPRPEEHTYAETLVRRRALGLQYTLHEERSVAQPVASEQQLLSSASQSSSGAVVGGAAGRGNRLVVKINFTTLDATGATGRPPG